MNRLQETRRANLEFLIQAKAAGNRSRFGREVGLDGNYISQMLREERSVGEKTARKIEEALDLPEKWLDTLVDPSKNPIQLSDDEKRNIENLVERDLRIRSIFEMDPSHKVSGDPARGIVTKLAPSFEGEGSNFLMVAKVASDEVDKKVKVINLLIQAQLSDDQLGAVEQVIKTMAAQPVKYRRTS